MASPPEAVEEEFGWTSPFYPGRERSVPMALQAPLREEAAVAVEESLFINEIPLVSILEI